MKIAFCISGELRTFLSQNVIDSYKNLCSLLSPDVYISVWDHVGVSHCHRNGIVVDFDDRINKDILIDTLPNIKDVDIENYGSWKNNLCLENLNIISNNVMDFRTKNSCSQLYKIFKCNEMKQKYETTNGFLYDIVFRMRPDFLFQTNLDLNIQQNTIYHINSGFAYYPNRIYDVFFYGDSVAMDKVCSTYNIFSDVVYDTFNNGLCHRDCCRILKSVATRFGINVVDGPIVGDVYRNNI